MGKVRVKPTKGNLGDKRPVDGKKGDSKPLVAGGLPEVQSGAGGEQLGHRLGLAFSTAEAEMAKTKKEKRKMRHEAFLKKLEAGKIVKSKRRKKKPCVPKALDLKNLVDALPTVVERTAAKPGTLARRLSSLGLLGMDLDGPRVRPLISAATLGAPWLGSKTGAILRSSPVLPGNRGAGDSGPLLDRSNRSSSYDGTAARSQQLHGQSGDGDAGHSRWGQDRDRMVRRQEHAERRSQVHMGTVPQSSCSGGQKRKLEQLYFE